MNFTNITVNQTLQEFFYTSSENVVYITDICKNYQLEIDSLIKQYLYTILIVFLLFNGITYLNKKVPKNAYIRWILKRLEFLNNNIPMAISINLLYYIYISKYDIPIQSIKILFIITIILISIKHRKDIIKDVKWIKKNLK